MDRTANLLKYVVPNIRRVSLFQFDLISMAVIIESDDYYQCQIFFKKFELDLSCFLGCTGALNKLNYGCLCLANLTNHVLIRLTFRSNKCLRLKYPESSHNLSSPPTTPAIVRTKFFASAFNSAFSAIQSALFLFFYLCQISIGQIHVNCL